MHNKSSKNGSARFWPTPKANEKVQSPEAHAKGFYALREAVEMPDYTQTSSPSTEPTTPGLTCSQGDFLANLSVSPGSEKARQMTVRFGRKCCELLGKPSQLGSLVRMLLESSRWNSTISFLTWKASATPRGRLLFRLVPSMPDTEETEFGLWPTPDTCAGGDGPSQQGRNGPRLQTVVRSWPTPKARDWKDGSSTGHNWNPNSDLGKAVLPPKFLPTPQANDDRDRGHAASGAVLRRIEKGKQVMLSQSVSTVNGSLNPNWVEWLMGYPIGHTACADWETRLSRRSPKKSSAPSPA